MKHHMKKIIFHTGVILMAAVLVIFFISCDPMEIRGLVENIVEEYGNGGGDTTAPTVESTNPAADATDAETILTVEAVFSEDLDETTITNETFTVEVNGSQITGTVAYDSETTTATFTSASRLPLLGSCTATIAETVTDTNNNALEGDYSWSFSIRDGSWDLAKQISLVNGVVRPDVALDPDGNGYVVWDEDTVVKGRWFDSADGLVASTDIEVIIDNSGVAISTPKIEFNSDGNALAVCLDSYGGAPRIIGNLFTAGNGWESSPFEIEGSSDFDNWDQGILSVEAGTTENFHTAWITDTGMGNYYIETDSNTDTGWEGTVPLYSDTTSAGRPDLAVSSDGTVFAVYFASETENRVRAHTYDGSWSGSTYISGNVYSIADAPVVAAGHTGKAVTVWGQQDGITGPTILYYAYYNGNNWESPVQLHSETDVYSYLPQVAADEAGNALVIYRQPSTTDHVLFGRRIDLTTGNADSTTIQISNEDIEINKTVLAVDPAGNAISAWVINSASLRASRYTVSNRTWRPPTTVYSYSLINNPAADISENGTAMIVWEHNMVTYGASFR